MERWSGSEAQDDNRIRPARCGFVPGFAGVVAGFNSTMESRPSLWRVCDCDPRHSRFNNKVQKSQPANGLCRAARRDPQMRVVLIPASRGRTGKPACWSSFRSCARDKNCRA